MRTIAPVFDIVVIGSGSAGQKATIQAAKAGRKVAICAQAPEIGIAELIGEMTHIIAAHDHYMTEQLTRNGIEIVHGRASFEDPHTLRIRHTNGATSLLRTEYVVIATGSKPRAPEHVAIDHEHIYDSDSILSLAYLP